MDAQDLKDMFDTGYSFEEAVAELEIHDCVVEAFELWADWEVGRSESYYDDGRDFSAPYEP